MFGQITRKTQSENQRAEEQQGFTSEAEAKNNDACFLCCTTKKMQVQYEVANHLNTWVHCGLNSPMWINM